MEVWRNMAVPIIVRLRFIYRIVEVTFPLVHSTVLHNSVPVPIIITLVKTEHKPNRDKREGDVYETIAVTENVQNAPWFIHVVRQTKESPRLKVVVLSTTKAGGLIHVTALPDWDFVYALKMADNIMGLFPERLFNFSAINTKSMPSMFPKNRLVTRKSPSPPSTIHSNLSEPSPFPPDSTVPENINIAHYKLRCDRIQQCKSLRKWQKKMTTNFKKDWFEDIAKSSGHKLYKPTPIRTLKALLNM